MFDQTFLNGAGKTTTSWTVTLSFMAEFAAIGAMILVPLVWTEVLPKAYFMNSLTAPAPPPPAPLPPAPVPVIRQARIAPRAFNHVLEAPREIPQQAPIIIQEALLLPSNLDSGMSGVPGAAPAGMAGVFSDGIGTGIPPRSPIRPPIADVKPKQEGPVAVGGKVQSAKLIKHPAPAYPAIAKSARIQGTVVLQAIIGKDGAVRNLTVVSAASPLLVPSAMDAVKQWVYQPTLLNQEPVEVITEITVIFALQ
jgi:protein TonB